MIYTISVIYILFTFDILAMSMEELKQYASQYKSIAKFSVEEDPQALTLSQTITIADWKTTVSNITEGS